MANIFGIDSNFIDVSEIYIDGESIARIYATNTKLSRFYQPIITTNNKLSYSLLTNIPDIALKSDLNPYVPTLTLNAMLNAIPLTINNMQVLSPYALKDEVNSIVIPFANTKYASITNVSIFLPAGDKY